MKNVWHVPLGRAEDIKLFKYKFIMTNQSKQIQRKRRKTYNIEGHAHELTFSCYHQYNYLNDPKCCTFIMEELSSAREKYQFYLWAYVLMPNHVHLLIYPFQSKYNISIILQAIKGKTSYRYRDFLRKEDPEIFKKICIQIRNKKVFRFWQVGSGHQQEPEDIMRAWFLMIPIYLF